MYKYVIEGGLPLEGEIAVSGAKNAALPILFATLLTDEECILRRVPDLRDIKTTFKLLECLGKTVICSRGTAVIRRARKPSPTAPYDLVKQMRASVLVAGPLLARFGHASVPLPGGCAIGLRPVDIHLKGFGCLGADVTTAGGNMVLSGKKLSGCHFRLGFPSVGATQNLAMCATLVPGATVLDNAALEPENDDLYDFLRSMGAQIVRKGGRIFINGVKRLHGASHTIVPDRIEAGTYLIAGAATRGRVTVKNCVPEHVRAVLDRLVKAGAEISETETSVTVNMKGRALRAVDMERSRTPVSRQICRRRGWRAWR
ncbi:MAG: UDP-N-acetylglucosamine 1-carboxyvinyltransferase [Elusimicrobiaceae bacterium]|nr:UDP-N-acetylglucosamine 1-carboxyvinyltransferase [Elusimicrobiaceae bacterium]